MFKEKKSTQVRAIKRVSLDSEKKTDRYFAASHRLSVETALEMKIKGMRGQVYTLNDKPIQSSTVSKKLTAEELKLFHVACGLRKAISLYEANKAKVVCSIGFYRKVFHSRSYRTDQRILESAYILLKKEGFL